MRSKLLDYFRPGKDARAANRIPDGRDAEMAEAEAAVAAAPAPGEQAVFNVNGGALVQRKPRKKRCDAGQKRGPNRRTKAA